MRFSESWLREHVDPQVDTKGLVEQLTMAGLEVESVAPAAPVFSDVVVGEVLEVQPHPDAGKLKVCRVAAGERHAVPLQIVCGAANVREGMKAPLALAGAELPGGVKIQRSKLRGVESFGMLCSAKELGLSETAEGLWELPQDAPVGADIRSWLNLDDAIIELDLTPNRADCLSIEGIAREVAALFRTTWRSVVAEPVTPSCAETLPVAVAADARALCPRYLGRLIREINPKASTPLWLKERLRRSGIRSLGPVVDVTNYVLLELGQPLHAFDANHIKRGIQVRLARPGERLVLLDGQTITLTDDVLVIADAELPLALAGIMGGQGSAVSSDSRDIFLECAFFAPEAILGRARRYGLHTESSHRFERGVDPALQSRALERATHLLVEIAGGKPGPVIEASAQAYLPKRPPIRLRLRRIQSVLGTNLEVGEAEDILRRLGMQVEAVANGEWQVVAPSFRFDVAIEEDLIEELARVYGYEHLPRRIPVLRGHMQPVCEGKVELARVQDLLADLGYQEAITYSFVDPKLQAKLTPQLEPVALANPISQEMAVMRTTLWMGLLRAASYNLNRQRSRIRLFEHGLTFWREGDKICQVPKLAGLIMGAVAPEQWAQTSRAVDLYDLKGDVEVLLRLTGNLNDFRFAVAQHPALHPKQAAVLLRRRDKRICGWLGMLHPMLAEEWGFDQDVFLFELDQAILDAKKIPKFKPLSKYPAIRRDLALVVSEKTHAQDVLDVVSQELSDLLTGVTVFDVWRGEGLARGEKSLAIGIVLQHPERTLTDAEVDAVVAQVLQSLAEKFQVRLRG
ncbi:MAG: phenylalanine--tRNA ligase subunit beta [Methylohalobius sp.]|nr:phenylalanine--tRNA ligase subunit beta [Methylohalobius sp.]